jgi:hypothetical protein
MKFAVVCTAGGSLSKYDPPVYLVVEADSEKEAEDLAYNREYGYLYSYAAYRTLDTVSVTEEFEELDEAPEIYEEKDE